MPFSSASSSIGIPARKKNQLHAHSFFLQTALALSVAIDEQLSMDIVRSSLWHGICYTTRCTTFCKFQPIGFKQLFDHWLKTNRPKQTIAKIFVVFSFKMLFCTKCVNGVALAAHCGLKKQIVKERSRLLQFIEKKNFHSYICLCESVSELKMAREKKFFVTWTIYFVRWPSNVRINTVNCL